MRRKPRRRPARVQETKEDTPAEGSEQRKLAEARSKAWRLLAQDAPSADRLSAWLTPEFIPETGLKWLNLLFFEHIRDSKAQGNASGARVWRSKYLSSEDVVVLITCARNSGWDVLIRAAEEAYTVSRDDPSKTAVWASGWDAILDKARDATRRAALNGARQALAPHEMCAAGKVANGVAGIVLRELREALVNETAWRLEKVREHLSRLDPASGTAGIWEYLLKRKEAAEPPD